MRWLSSISPSRAESKRSRAADFASMARFPFFLHISGRRIARPSSARPGNSQKAGSQSPELPALPNSHRLSQRTLRAILFLAYFFLFFDLPRRKPPGTMPRRSNLLPLSYLLTGYIPRATICYVALSSSRFPRSCAARSSLAQTALPHLSPLLPSCFLIRAILRHFLPSISFAFSILRGAP